MSEFHDLILHSQVAIHPNHTTSSTWNPKTTSLFTDVCLFPTISRVLMLQKSDKSHPVEVGSEYPIIYDKFQNIQMVLFWGGFSETMNHWIPKIRQKLLETCPKGLAFWGESQGIMGINYPQFQKWPYADRDKWWLVISYISSFGPQNHEQ